MRWRSENFMVQWYALRTDRQTTLTKTIYFVKWWNVTKPDSLMENFLKIFTICVDIAYIDANYSKSKSTFYVKASQILESFYISIFFIVIVLKEEKENTYLVPTLGSGVPWRSADTTLDQPLYTFLIIDHHTILSANYDIFL